MTQSWFRMSAAGRVVGLSDSSLSVAEMNLAPGQYLLPFDPTVNPRTDIWDKAAEQWVRGGVTLQRPEDDPRYMRHTGYPSQPDQVGALMKLAAAILSGNPVTDEIRTEFAPLFAAIEGVKAAHPKPKTLPA